MLPVLSVSKLTEVSLLFRVSEFTVPREKTIVFLFSILSILILISQM